MLITYLKLTEIYTFSVHILWNVYIDKQYNFIFIDAVNIFLSGIKIDVLMFHSARICFGRTKAETSVLLRVKTTS